MPNALVLRPAAAVFIAVAGLLSSQTILAAGAPLTLRQAQRLAVERSRQVAARDASASASREMAIAAGELPDPVLRAGIDNLPVDGADRFRIGDDFMTMRRIGVTQEFTRSEKLRLRSQRFELEAEKSLAEKDASIAAVERDTALAWLDRHYAESIAVLVDRQMGEARLEIEAAASAYRGARGSQADIFAARSALATLEDHASEAARRVRTAQVALERWVGDAARYPLAGEPSTDAIRADLGSLEAHLRSHPEIEALVRQEEIAATEAKLAQADKKADWSVELMYSQRGPAFSNMVSIGVSVPLQWNPARRQDREIAAKLALAEEARAARDDMFRAHVAEVRAMAIEWKSDRERRARYDAEIIPLAAQRTQAALGAYRGGKSSLTEVLAARGAELEVRLQALRLAQETAGLWARLEFLFPIDAEMKMKESK